MKIIYIFALSILFVTPLGISASVSSGTIDSGNKKALICHSVDCITPTPGVINFAPTGTTPVTIDDTNGIDGVAWGNSIGWINFDPTGIEGVTIDATTGILSGRAWSQGAGWINFSVTGQSVRINSAGEFIGYAWTGGPNGGWIKFDCTFAGACVKTDWRPVGARPSVGMPIGGNSGGSTPQNNILNSATNDVCLNIPGIQDTIPSNYAKDQGGLCLLNIDYCKNIAGIQLTVPNAYVLNTSGQCVLLTDKNEKEFIPDTSKNNSTTSTSGGSFDYCSNLFGLQSELPEGFVQVAGECLPKETDYCSNLLGNQYSMPENMKIANSGECVKMTSSEIQKNNTFKEESKKFEAKGKTKVLGYSFIPDFLKLSFELPFLTQFLKAPVRVDVFSLFITVIILAVIVYFVRRKIRA